MMAVDYSFLGKEVPVASVGKELKLLWEVDETSTKASLMNFTIYSEAGDSLSRNSEAMMEITREHACRAILMDLDRNGKDPSVKAWVTAHCNLSGGKKSVCCEQVAFKANGYTPGIVRHTLFSHLDSDLPMVLWWQGDFSESFRESFYSSVDRLLFDSSEWSDPKLQFKKILDALEEVKSLVIQDLAWTRTYQIRLSFAGLVDEPIVESRLHQISSIKVKVHPSCRTSGLQYLAWISVMSGFERSPDLLSVEGDVFTMTKPNGGEVKLSLETDATSSEISLVEVEMGDLLLQLERHPERNFIDQRLLLNGEETLSRVSPADSENAVGLISNQLSRGGKNSLFRKILPAFIEML